MTGRVRRKILGLVALGFRQKRYRAKFEWIFGVPTARQVKRGVSWTLRTPARIVKLGFKPENYLGMVEADIRLREATKSELVELFYRMMQKWVEEKEKEGFEAVWIKILPHSKIAKLLRGRNKVRDENTSIATLPLFAKDSCGLWEVFFEHGRRGIRLKLMPLKPVDNKRVIKKITLPRNVLELGATALLKVVKETLKKEGFQPLVYRVPQRRKPHKVGDWKWNTPWDYIIYAPGLMLASAEEKVRRLLIPKLRNADPKYRGYILSCMIEMWRVIHSRYVIGRIVDEITFEMLRKWFMPHERCDNIDNFKESLESIRRCFGLELWEIGRLYGKAIRWWLHQDALAYLQKLLTEKSKTYPARLHARRT